MILRVSPDGLHIPKEMLGDAEEVEVRPSNGHLVVVLGPRPAESTGDPEGESYRSRSIFELGRNPITLGVTDASVNTDKYAYGDPHGLETRGPEQ